MMHAMQHCIVSHPETLDGRPSAVYLFNYFDGKRFVKDIDTRVY